MQINTITHYIYNFVKGMPRVFISSITRDLFNFSSRANRTEYAQFTLCWRGIGLLMYYIFVILQSDDEFIESSIILFDKIGILHICTLLIWTIAIYLVVSIVVSILSSQVRRLKDIGIPGWVILMIYILIIFTPYLETAFSIIIIFLPSKKIDTKSKV
jgi:uncharacterized membrane protein YhaH (DUF805 family)